MNLYRVCVFVSRVAKGESLGRLLIPLIPPVAAVAAILAGRVEDRSLLLALIALGWSLASLLFVQCARLYVERERWRLAANSPEAPPGVANFLRDHIKPEKKIERA